jgi:hypothetical protein
MDRLRRELDDTRDQMQNVGRSKGDEVSSLLAKFNKEKQDLEAALLEKQALIDEFLRQLEDQQGDADHIRQVYIHSYPMQKSTLIVFFYVGKR